MLILGDAAECPEGRGGRCQNVSQVANMTVKRKCFVDKNTEGIRN